MFSLDAASGAQNAIDKNPWKVSHDSKVENNKSTDDDEFAHENVYQGEMRH